MRLLLFVVSVFVVCVSNISGLKILALCPYAGRSHQMIFDPLLTELLGRGHTVKALSHAPLKTPIGDYHYIDMNSPLTHTGAWGLEQYDFHALGLEALHDTFSVYYGFLTIDAIKACEFILSSAAAKALYFGDEVFDLILTEAFNSNCMYAYAHKMNIPVVSVQTHHITPFVTEWFGQPDNPSYIPSWLSRFTDEMSMLERLENAVGHYVQKLTFDSNILKREEEVIKEKLGVTIESLEELAKRTTVLMLSNTHHVLNLPRPLVPAIKEVGGMHVKSKLDTLNKDIERFINESQHGVILFSLGSLLNTTTINPEKIKTFIKVFSELPQRVIWKFQGDLPNKPDNVMLVKWVQQQEILSHKNVRCFIGHGGLLGVTEAVHYGVPILVLSVFGDQPLNGAAVAKNGIGDTIAYRDITEDRLRKSIQKILSSEVQSKAKIFSRQWKDRPMPPLKEAVFWIEYVGKYPHAQLSSTLRDIPFYAAALLDIGLLIIVFTAAILYIMYRIIVLSMFILFSRRKCSNDKDKQQ